MGNFIIFLIKCYFFIINRYYENDREVFYVIVKGRDYFFFYDIIDCMGYGYKVMKLIIRVIYCVVNFIMRLFF